MIKIGEKKIIHKDCIYFENSICFGDGDTYSTVKYEIPNNEVGHNTILLALFLGYYDEYSDGGIKNLPNWIQDELKTLDLLILNRWNINKKTNVKDTDERELMYIFNDSEEHSGYFGWVDGTDIYYYDKDGVSHDIEIFGISFDKQTNHTAIDIMLNIYAWFLSKCKEITMEKFKDLVRFEYRVKFKEIIEDKPELKDLKIKIEAANLGLL